VAEGLVVAQLDKQCSLHHGWVRNQGDFIEDLKRAVSGQKNPQQAGSFNLTASEQKITKAP